MSHPQPKSTSAPTRDLAVRIRSALLLIPVALLAVWLGDWAFTAFMGAVGAAVAWEWTRLVHGPKARIEMIALAASAVGAALATLTAGVPVALLVAAAFWVAAVLHAATRRQAVGWAVAATPYVCLPVIALIQLRLDPVYGLSAVVWLFVVVWATDIFAYFAGRTIGGPRLAPRASPNKTWAGLLGGVAGASLSAVAYATWAIETSAVALALLAGVLAVTAQAGDIAESAMKRHFGVKDTSNLIPGHGGVMDRVDGLVSAAVLAFLLGALRSGTENAAHGVLIW